MLFIPGKIKNTHNTNTLTVQEGENLYSFDEFYFKSRYKVYEVVYESDRLIIVKDLHKFIYDHNFKIIEHIPANIIARIDLDSCIIIFSPSPLDPFNSLYELYSLDTIVSIENTGETLTLSDFRKRYQPRYTIVSLSADEIILNERH